jgi:hypothetical protein
MRLTRFHLVSLPFLLWFLGCGTNDGSSSGAGGTAKAGAGGATSQGGASGSGGATNSGGLSGSGGTPSTGGATGRGGAAGSGSVPNTSGTMGSGGVTGSGGMAGTSGTMGTGTRRGVAAHQAAMAVRQPEMRQTQIPQILAGEVREDSIPVPQLATARFCRSETPSRRAQAPNQAITGDIVWSFSPKRWPTASTSLSSGV